MLQEAEGEEGEGEGGDHRRVTSGGGGDESTGDPEGPDALEKLPSERRNKLAALAPALDLSSLLKGAVKEEKQQEEGEDEEAPVSYRSDQLGAVSARAHLVCLST